MRTIKKVLSMCSDDCEMLCTVIVIAMGYLLVAGVFYNFHWMCSLLSPFLVTALLDAGGYVEKTLEDQEDIDEFNDK